MYRVSKPLIVGILASALVLSGTAQAQTATTTTSSTTTSTSTTLLPHPFSPDTRACIKDARQAYRHCPGTKDDCLKAFQAAYAKCFAGTVGEKCATKCPSAWPRFRRPARPAGRRAARPAKTTPGRASAYRMVTTSGLRVIRAA